MGKFEAQTLCVAWHTKGMTPLARFVMPKKDKLNKTVKELPGLVILVNTGTSVLGIKQGWEIYAGFITLREFTCGPCRWPSNKDVEKALSNFMGLL